MSRVYQVALIAGGLWISSGPDTLAELTSEMLPSVKIIEGQLISVTQANSYYGSSTTSTDGLCAFQILPGSLGGSPPELCTNGVLLPPVEVMELARSLRNDPDLIYEYVANTIDTEFLFGSHKGPAGTITDKSGTPFDQAQLLVQLFREAGLTATYTLGTVTLTGAQFEDWTGITNAQAACKLLATGGFPAAVNGSTQADCQYSGNVASVSLLHIWVEATIDGSDYFFDPSLKSYDHITALDLIAEAGLTSGEAFGAALVNAQTGVLSGENWVSNLNQDGLDAIFSGYASNLLSRMRQPDLAGANLGEIIGGREIVPLSRPPGGWRRTKPSNYSVQATWSGDIPDQYRARLNIYGYIPHPVNVGEEMEIVSGNFFSDEIYGNKLQIYFRRDPPLGPVADPEDPNPWEFFPRLAWGNYPLDEGPGCESSPIPVYCDQGNLPLYLRISADHPFAGESGQYADAIIERFLHFSYPISIVHGWGNISQDMADLWSRLISVPILGGFTMTGPLGEREHARVPTKSGAKERAQAGANWLAQFTRAANIHAEIAKGRVTHHHTIGVAKAEFEPVYPNYFYPMGYDPSALPKGVTFADETLVLDLETSFGLTLRQPDAISRRAALHAIAATAAALEGSGSEHQFDAPDASSTARRFAWGNAPEAGETPDTTSRKVFHFDSQNTDSIENVLVTENLTTGVHPTFGPFQQIPMTTATAASFQGGLKNHIQTYINNGFAVTASSEALLGPGNRLGSEIIAQTIISSAGTNYTYVRLPSMQAGGAFVANKYATDGDPTEIAHVILRRGRPSKGGGGPSITQSVQYDPNTAADVLKDEFVDRSVHLGVDIRTGTASYTTPVLDSVGFGDFPYMLTSTAALTKREVEKENDGIPTAAMGNFIWNWTGTAEISSSAMEAMGASRPDMAAETIAAFLATQDIYRESPSKEREVAGLLAVDWWTRRMLHNVVTVRQGASGEQYIRGHDGKYLPAGGGAGEAVVTGKRVAHRATVIWPGTDGATQWDAITRLWKEDDSADPVSIKVRSAAGDQREYGYWKRPVPPPTVTTLLNGDGLWGNDENYANGHRLTRWRFQRGVDLTLAYDDPMTYPSNPQPITIHSSLGYQLGAPDAGQAKAGYFTNAKGDTMRVTGTVTGSASTTICTYSTRLAEGPIIGEVYDFIDATTPALRYTYDCLNRVKTIEDAEAIRDPGIAPYGVFIAPGFRGEREDPLGGSYSIEFLRGGKETRHTDEVGNVTTSYLDGRGRVLERVLPEGQRVLFEYDDRNNVIKRTVKAKPGSAEPDIVSEADYHTFWNKPVWIKDPKGRQTDFTYAGTADFTFTGGGKGEIATVDLPEIGGIRPNYTYTYNSAGKVLTITDPELTVHRTTYDDRGYPSCTIVNDGNLNLATGYEFNDRGDITATVDPRGMSRAWCVDGQRLPANAGGQ